MKRHAIASILLLTGCPDGEARAPVIASFTADSNAIGNGETVMLSWQVENAIQIRINAEPGGLVAERTELSGTVESDPLRRTTAFILTAIGSDQIREQMVVIVQVAGGGGVAIERFEVSPEVIPLGDSAELSWEVQNSADAIVLISDRSSSIVYQGTDLIGTQSVQPDATELYSLVVVDRASRGSAGASVFLQVNPPGSARIVSFTAQPATINLGGTSALSWSVENAPEGIEIRANGETIATSLDAAGTFAASPLVTTDYQLVALNPIGDARDTLTVTVAPSPPLISELRADPNPAALGELVRLSWSVFGAEQIAVSRGATVLLDVPAAQDPGYVDVEIDELTTDFILEASNGSGISTEVVTVVADAAPLISSFTSDVVSFTGNASVLLAWEVSGATQIWLTANGAAVPGFPGTSSGTISVAIQDTTVFELAANNAYGLASSQLTVAESTAEIEPNDFAGSATPLPGATSAITGAVGNGDVDWFSIDVPAGGWVRAYVATPSCAPVDLALLDRDAATVRGAGSGAPGACASIDPSFAAFARNLAGGRYYLSLDSFAAVPYELIVQVGSAACGNAIPEIGEACDDGNRTGGDGCSSSCAIEPLGFVQGPPADMTFSGAFAGVLHFYQVQMSSAGIIRAETFVPSAPSCAGDTDLILFDSTGSIAGVDQDGGTGLCSRLAASVTAGEYLIAVQAIGPTDYSVRIEALDFGCGNGAIEAGETCDDGNQLPGDGCSPACSFEGPAETEPNDAFDSLGVITSTMSAAYSGILGANDVDFWAVDVPDGWSISAALTLGGSSQCPFGFGAPRIFLHASDGSAIIAESFVDPTGACPSIDPAIDDGAAGLAAGTYYVSIATDGPNPSSFDYELALGLVAPACPNGIRDGSDTCDDGNAIPGDGCDPACQIEVDASHTLPQTGSFSIAGANTPAGDIDVYRLDVPAGPGVLLTARTFVPNQAMGCVAGAGDTVLELYDDGFDSIAFNDDNFPGLCSLISTVPLAGGESYFLTIRSYSPMQAIASYEISVTTASANVCGNGLAEASNNEQCDDGNTGNGDGCNATCTFEIAATIDPPGGTADVNIPAGAFTTVRVNLTQLGQSITATASSGGACPAGLGLTLLDSNFVALGSSGGPPFPSNGCSIRVPADGFAFDRSPGTYHVRIDPSGPGLVNLTVGIIDAACGDGRVNGSLLEECDDGNAIPGDGCDAACQFEGNIAGETEVNDNQSNADATGLTGAGTIVVSGSVTTTGDDDVFSFTVPASTTLMLTARTHTQLGNPSSCDNSITDTRIFVEAAGIEAFLPGTGELAYNDDISAANPSIWCSLITGLPLSGGASGATYFIRVQGYNDAVTPTYFMTITLQ